MRQHDTNKETKMAKMMWTVCFNYGFKTKAFCQYENKERAEAHAKSNGADWFVKEMPSNPERVIVLKGRNRSCEGRKRVGLPQYK